jgi:hypothetical protein
MSTNLICVEKMNGHKQLNCGKRIFWYRDGKLVEATSYCNNGKFCGDTLFQQKLFWWRQIVVATA